MSKDSFYFSHDYGARNDPKVMRLKMKYGMEGVGIYWCMIEMLYEQDGYIPLINIEGIAYELHTECECIKSVLQDFDLFKFKDEFFYSDSVLLRLKARKDRSETARKSANKRWLDANAMQTHSDSNANKGKERKEKEIPNTWKTSFDVYLKECKDGYRMFLEDKELLKEQSRLNPGVNIALSIEKGFKNYWGTEAGWKKKKSSRTKDIDWKSTIINSIEFNKVYLPRNAN